MVKACSKLMMVGVVAAGACGPGEPLYKAELRTLERDLSQREVVECVQQWIGEDHTDTAWLAQENWPECVRDLEPMAVRRVDGEGVEVTLQGRGRFVALVLPTLAVYPPGKRPALDVHEPSVEKPGYLGAFGGDAYIRFSEK